MSNLQSLSPTEIAFVDVGVADSSSLIAQFQAGTEVHLLDASQDAIAQITQILASRSNISAIHILSHGSNGALLLGGESLSNLSGYDDALQLWAQSLTANADILLYGCNVAADSTGQGFVSQLAALTGADVAASTDLTGSSALGGDWELEFSTGSIEASGALADWAQAAYQNVLAIYTVNTLADTGAGSLRQAITDANASVGVADTINFSVTGTITLASVLSLTDSAETTINGAGSITVSGNNATRVFNVAAGAAAALNGLIISGGRTIGNNGGGILNNGTLTVSNSTFTGNSAQGNGFGGGIYSDGTLTVSNSTFTGNSAGNPGGAIDNRGTMTVSNSTFTGNRASGGGAIDNNGTLTVSNSTFTGNSAVGGGGILNQPQGRLTVSNSTFTGNSASEAGGGIFHGGVTLTVSNSIVAGNASPNGREIRSLTPVTSGGYNLFGFNGDSGLVNITTVSTDVIPTVDLSAILDTTLRDNGGPTQTLALVAGSPAINAGDTALTTDQRGIARPQGSADDIGAFEFVPSNSPPTTAGIANVTVNEDAPATVINLFDAFADA
ncbi:MAG: DUF4347 domain-containing protein, partial [Elainella sp. C42_A2020_010]|nr:DUF4347 domain-containing protein [Elainella sp. C42_A2020_010]